MKRIFKIRIYCMLLFLSLITIYGFTNQEQFNIDGTINGKYEGYLYLYYNNTKDSVLVKNNKFKFSGSVPYPCAALLVTSSQNHTEKDFYIENTNIKIGIDIIEEINANKISYTPVLKSLLGTRTQYIRDDFENFKIKNEKLPDWNTRLFQKLNDISKQNTRNSYSGNLLYEYSQGSLLSISQIKEILGHLNQQYQTKFVIEYLKNKTSYKLVTKGSKIPNFKLLNDKGKWITNKKYEGSYLLIDFWASWCAPCRKEFPELKRILKKYNSKNFNIGNKGFKIVGISIDDSKKKWLSVIKKDSITWETANEKGGFASKTATAFGINALPTNFLIDKSGYVIDVNLTTTELELFLDKSFKNKSKK